MRTPGGAFDEVKKKTVYDPFREATGIEIVPVASTAAKLLGMFKAGQVDIDVIDTADDVLLQLERAGALEPMPYKDFKYTNPDDVEKSVRLDYQVGSFVYAFLLGFNTSAYAVGKEPKNWAEFWDVKAFPGTRTYPQMLPQLVDPATKLPWTVSNGFRNDIVWWADNRVKVSEYWNKWVLQ